MQGEIERRFKHRAGARATLTRALELFDELGAARWSEMAAAELARIPGRSRASPELTETERRVAELVAEGLSNKEVASRLARKPAPLLAPLPTKGLLELDLAVFEACDETHRPPERGDVGAGSRKPNISAVLELRDLWLSHSEPIGYLPLRHASFAAECSEGLTGMRSRRGIPLLLDPRSPQARSSVHRMVLDELQHSVCDSSPRVAANLGEERLPVFEVAPVEQIVERRRSEGPEWCRVVDFEVAVPHQSGTSRARRVSIPAASAPHAAETSFQSRHLGSRRRYVSRSKSERS